jgi:phosphoglycerol transferase MdoB-like AlkP superfamily enzyme
MFPEEETLLPPPQYGTLGTLIPNKTDRFKAKPIYQDTWAAVLFMLSLVPFGFLSYLAFTALPSVSTKPKLDLQLVGLFLTCLATAFVLSLAYFLAILSYAGQMIVGTMMIAIG